MDQFNKWKSILSGFFMSIGCLFLILAAAGIVFGTVLVVGNKIKEPTPLIIITAGKKFEQKMTAPEPTDAVEIMFDNAITKLVMVDPQRKTVGVMQPRTPLLFVVDLLGGKKMTVEEMTPNEKERFEASKTTFTLDRAHFQRSNKLAQWQLSDDDIAKFHKFYNTFADKFPKDTDAENKYDLAGNGYHYAWVFGIWGVILLAAAIGLRRFNPDLY
jgi:hypothetical protein